MRYLDKNSVLDSRHSKSGRSSFHKIKLSVLGIVVLSLWACHSGGKKEDAKSGIVIGVSMLSLQSEFIVNVKDAMVARAKELHVELNITDAQRTAEKQVQQIETFISQKVDAIILNPCEVEASSPAVDKARAAGIPIINVNSETKSEPDAFVGSNDEISGEIAMEYIAKSINYKGNIVIMDGYMGQAAQIKRATGAQKVLAKYPEIKVLAEQTAEWDRAKGMTLMENWIQSYGDKINAVFAHNDEMGLGALQALEQSKMKDKVVLVSIDAIADALQAVEDGRLNATIYQDAKGQGNGAVETAIALIKKEKLSSRQVLIPFQLVTKENINNFLKN
ncbi:MAG: sugar ABC transporter substrate-binding protein [Chitinophagaceae bacterium]